MLHGLRPVHGLHPIHGGMRSSRRRAHSSPLRRSLEPTIRAVARGARGYGLSVQPPHGNKMVDAEFTHEDGNVLVISGVLQPSTVEYVTRRALPVYSTPSRMDGLAGILPGGTTVRGGLVTHGGWIALDEDDESWVFDDGTSLAPLFDPAPISFRRRVELPSDAMPARATVEPLGQGALVTVPRAWQLPFAGGAFSASDAGRGIARPDKVPPAKAHTKGHKLSGRCPSPPPPPSSPVASSPVASSPVVVPSVPSPPETPRSAWPPHLPQQPAQEQAAPSLRHRARDEKDEATAAPASTIQPPILTRGLSRASQAACDAMMQAESEIDQLVRKRDAAAARLAAASPGQDSPAGLRNQLAQLWSQLNRVLETKLDALVTTELLSGREQARATRKRLIGRTQGLIEEVEAQVKQCDEIAREAPRGGLAGSGVDTSGGDAEEVGEEMWVKVGGGVAPVQEESVMV